MKANYTLTAALLLAGASATVMFAGGNTAVLAEAAQTFEVSSTPENGATVKQFNEITIKINSQMGEFMVLTEDAKLSDVTVTKEGGSAVAATGFGEPGMDDSTFELLYPIEFPTQTEAGKYTISLPEGLFVESVYDNQKDAFVPAENGKVNAATTISITVDPNAKNPIDNFTLSPASGSVVGSLNGMYILFPEIDNMSMPYNSSEDVEMTLSNGTVTYNASAMVDWDWYEGGKKMNFSFTDDNYEDAVLTPGKWTLNAPAGAFEYEGTKSEAFTAEYTIVSPSETTFTTWNTFPANNAELKNLSSVRLMYKMNDLEASLNVDSNLLEKITLTRDGKKMWVDFELGDPEMIMNDAVVMIPLSFDNQNMPGEFELTIPEGFLYQTKYNETTQEFGVFDGYQQSAEQVLKFTIATDAEGLFDDYSLSPETENGVVTSLSDMTLTFNSIPSYIKANVIAFEDITLTQGSTVYTGIVKESNSASNLAYDITFVDSNDQVVTPGSGKWTLEIPSLYFSLDSDRSGEIKREYEVVPIKLTPASGSTLSEITYFEVSFPGAKNVEFVGAEYMITLTAGQSSGIPSFDVAKVDGATDPTFRLTPPEGFAEPALGTVNFNIEEGAFLIDGEAGATVGNSPRVHATYIYDRPVSQTYTPEPNNAEVLCQSWGYTVGFAFDETVSPRFTDMQTFNGIEVKFDDTVLTIGTENQAYAGKADCAYSVMENILTFMVINQEYHKEGKITVKLNADAYTLSGNPGFDVEHSWNVVMPKTIEFTLTPAGSEDKNKPAEVTTFNNLMLTFDNASKAEVFQPTGISLKKDDYSLFMTASIEPVADSEKPEFKLIFTPEEGKQFSNGNYELEIRYDTFTLDGIYTWPANYTNIVRYFKFEDDSAVNEIEAGEAENVTVVTPDGKVVLHNAPASQLKSLDNGIYIVNGKKIVIR